jgi:hypothetical protein
LEHLSDETWAMLSAQSLSVEHRTNFKLLELFEVLSFHAAKGKLHESVH